MPGRLSSRCRPRPCGGASRRPCGIARPTGPRRGRAWRQRRAGRGCFRAAGRAGAGGGLGGGGGGAGGGRGGGLGGRGGGGKKKNSRWEKKGGGGGVGAPAPLLEG